LRSRTFHTHEKTSRPTRVTPMPLHQRLKLASVSLRLRRIYRDGQMSSTRYFTLTDGQAPKTGVRRRAALESSAPAIRAHLIQADVLARRPDGQIRRYRRLRIYCRRIDHS
jgi:hypothetical protein